MTDCRSDRAVGTVFRATDVAAFAAALTGRLRTAGVPVDLTGAEAFSRGLPTATRAGAAGSPRSRLYWTARITLVRDKEDLPVFDAVFAAVFDAAGHAEGHSHAQPAAGSSADTYVPVDGRADGDDSGGGLPWATLPAAAEADDGAADGVRLPFRSPSALEGSADVPFGGLDAVELARLTAAVAAARWPTRRSRRREVAARGSRIALRPTLARARRSGWEPLILARERPVVRRRTVVLMCDVSQSMQQYAPAYLLLMRALARTTECEVFAFATSLTRLTPTMKRLSADAAVAEASEKVTDRFGGTRIATNINACLRSVHGSAVRGGVVLIASDGWDNDEPRDLGLAMARLRRRAHRVVWLNPRAAAPGFAPLTGPMRAALPYCDSLLPAHDTATLAGVVRAIASTV